MSLGWFEGPEWDDEPEEPILDAEWDEADSDLTLVDELSRLP